jgi:hypothetical protein
MAIGPTSHAVDGIGPCDRDQFNGTLAELQALWGGPTVTGATHATNDTSAEATTDTATDAAGGSPSGG